MLKAEEILGETIGTFMLVFFGNGAVAVTVLFSSHSGLFQVAAVWGLGVALAIYATRHLSCAHLNPAVSLSMVLGGRMSMKRLPGYLGAQFAGAFLAALVLYFLFSHSIAQYEVRNGLIRGMSESSRTAMMFGEFYPNPMVEGAAVTVANAFLAEAVGTFALVFLIFSLTEGCNVGRPDSSLQPLFIGLTVAVIICVIGPLTQAGINPARDLSPRLFAYAAGWKKAAMPDGSYGFLTVYVLGPMVGGGAASLFFTRILEPLMSRKGGGCKEVCK